MKQLQDQGRSVERASSEAETRQSSRSRLITEKERVSERGRFLDVKTFSRCCVKRTRRDANEVGTLPSISIMHATTKFTHGSTDNMNNNFHHSGVSVGSRCGYKAAVATRARN